MNFSSFHDFINYKIIETENYSVTIYSIVVSILLFALFLFLLKVIKKLFKRLSDKGILDEGTSHSIYQIVKYILWVVAILLSLETIGVKISIILASATALMVGVGLGIQQIFNDIASGIILLVEGNLKVEDVIQLEDGTVGKVIEIGLRTSKIKSRDDIILIVPNSKFVSSRIINWTHIVDETRFNVDVGVAYGSDVQKVKKILLECADNHPSLAKSPKPFVRFSNFGESSLDFQLFFWVTHSFRVENIKSDIRFEIDRLFRENGITIPFPQRDVHIYNDKQ